MQNHKPKALSLFWMMLTIVAAIAIAGCGGSNNNSTGTSPGNLDGYFVNPTGNDTNPGTKDQPFRTVQAALDYAAQQAQPSTVYLAASIYTLNQTLQLRGGINIKGGYDPVTWERDISTKKTIIEGPQNMPVLNGYHQNSILVEGIVIMAPDAVDSSQYPDNKSVVAVTLDSCFAITFAKDSVVTGDGLIGVDGNSPTYHSDGDNGASGQNGGVCPNSGGAGGYGFSYDYNNDGGDGANGGAAGGFSGSAGSGPNGGSGGSGGSLAGDGHRGTNGGPGVAGTNGSGGESFGMLNGTAYIVANGITGGAGTPGSGGGGGGSGGGSIVGLCGGGGGGGGGGGYQGYAGGRGEGGGASIGFIIANYSNVHVDSSYIVTGNGGDGGAGGTGGPGGSGGSGGSGGTSGFGTGAGGRGGDGGAGGRGGNGGGGGGGPVVGILDDANSQTTRSGNTFVLGNAGTGGISSSNAGADGERTEYMKLTE